MLKIGGIRLVEVDDDSKSRKTIDWIECLILSLKNPRKPLQKVQKKLELAMDTIHHHRVKRENMQIQ
jgi:hypothetical protein